MHRPENPTPPRERAYLPLIRLLGLVAAGHRRPRLLAEALGLELREVHELRKSAESLGCIQGIDELRLTAVGLDILFADPTPRRSRIQEQVRGFSSERGPRQLHLGPTMPRRGSPRPVALEEPVDLRAGLAHNPDLLARLLNAFLDEGELASPQIRATLDAMGADEAEIPPTLEVLEARGDIRREGTVWLATNAAASRAICAEDPILFALSEPGYRRFLARAELDPARLPPLLRREAVQALVKYSPWDARIFGDNAEGYAPSLRRLLHARPLSSIPEASASPKPANIPICTGSWLGHLDQTGLPLAFPRSLQALAGGIALINPLLLAGLRQPQAVRLSAPTTPRQRVHAGILSPGEPAPRSLPDNLSLRLRALTRAPAISLLGALLLLARRPEVGISVCAEPDGFQLRFGRLRIRGLIEIFRAFVADQGWTLLHPHSTGISDPALLSTARALGLLARAGRHLTLEDNLLSRLQEDAEAHLAYEALLPLEERLHDWLLHQSPARRVRPP